MGIIPHATVPIGHLRPHDIILLLGLGALWELVVRILLVRYRTKPRKLIQREQNLKSLQLKVTQWRNKGPTAFVETSKLERQLLAEEKAMAETTQKRDVELAMMEKRVKTANYLVSGIIFFLWYGVPILEFASHRLEGKEVILDAEHGQELANSAYKAFLFPLSVVGVGIKVSKFGLTNPQASSGALLAFWSSQTTVGMIMDGVDALLA